MARVRSRYVRASELSASPFVDGASGNDSGSGVADTVLWRITVSVRLPLGADISTAMVLDLKSVLLNFSTALSAES